MVAVAYDGHSDIFQALAGLGGANIVYNIVYFFFSSFDPSAH
jgi:hypothetical protein